MTKRDATKPFTQSELQQIETDAILAGDEERAQLAGIMIDAMSAYDKELTIRKVLLKAAESYLLLSGVGLETKSILGRSHNALQELVDGLNGKGADDKPELLAFHWEHGTPWELKFKGSWAALVIGQGLMDLMTKPDGDGLWNNITMKTSYKTEKFSITVERQRGKTVKDQLDEAEAARDAALKELAEVKAYLANVPGFLPKVL